MKNPLKRGENLSDLCRPLGQKTYSFEHNEKSYEVHYKSVEWEARLNAIEAGWKEKARVDAEGETVYDLEFATGQYYTDMWKEAIIDINGMPVSPALLKTLDHPVITHLMKLVPGPLLSIQVSESKKDSEPLNEED